MLQDPVAVEGKHAVGIVWEEVGLPEVCSDHADTASAQVGMTHTGLLVLSTACIPLGVGVLIGGMPTEAGGVEATEAHVKGNIIGQSLCPRPSEEISLARGNFQYPHLRYSELIG